MTTTVDLMTEHLTEAQEAAFHMFRDKLERWLPQYRITAVHALKENLIQVWVESDEETYQTGLKAAKLAVEVGDKTGIFIILR
jgi:hypothetical protein